MTPVVHKLTLTGPEHVGGKLPPRHLGFLLTEIQPAARAAVAMAFRNQSRVKGKAPDWLRRASDIRFSAFGGNGETTLVFEAPHLREAASDLYKQGELFPTRPDGADTALDLLTDVLADVAAGEADSVRFDDPLLRKIARFRRVFDGPFDELQVSSRRERPGRISPPVISSAEQLSARTPPPRRVRIVGTLDTISQSQTFALRMDDGEMVRGVLQDGAISDIVPHFGKRVLVFGTAHFRPSGNLLRIDADEFRPATEKDNFFAKVPKPLGLRAPKPSSADRERMAKSLRAVMGQWPGDETDEEVEAALKELS